MLKLSIVIVNYNSGKFLKECLLSIGKSFLPKTDFEIIIVDNRSDDDSLQRVENLNLNNPKIIKNDKNIGFARANNIGISNSLGQYILLLNPDTILEENTLSKMIEYMDKNKEVAVATCRVLLDKTGQLDDACHRGFPTPWNASCYFSGLAKLFPKSQLFDGYHLAYSNLNKTHEIDSCVGAFMIVRRSIGDKLGWLDEDYFWYGEDLDFCFRVKQSGWKVMYVPLTQIIHFKGITSGLKSHSKDISTASLSTKRLATESRYDVMKLFYRKHYNGKYPFPITDLVLLGINLKRFFSLLKLGKSYQ